MHHGKTIRCFLDVIRAKDKPSIRSREDELNSRLDPPLMARGDALEACEDD